MQSSRIPLLWPVSILLLATCVLRFTDLDSSVCGLFFGVGGDWPLLHAQPYLFFYEYGPLPGYVIGIAGFSVWLTCVWRHRDIARRGFFCGMLVLLGPGLIVNGILKPHVQRPRPCQTLEFGGAVHARPVLAMRKSGPEFAKSKAEGRPFNVADGDERELDLADQSTTYKSFPSGHASMGFATLAIPFLVRRRRKLFFVSMSLSVSWGLCVGISRVVQGRHYPSDVLWSAGIVYVLAVLLYHIAGLARTKPLALRSLLNVGTRKGTVPLEVPLAVPPRTVIRFPTTGRKPVRRYSLAGSAKAA